MSLDDWVLALHVLSAFALVAGIILFWVLILAAWRADTPDETLAFGPFARIAQAVVGIGMIGAIVFGVWLAFSVGGYDIWDGWVVAALVLWLIGGGLGNRAGRAFAPAVNRALELKKAGHTGPDAELAALNRTTHGLVLQLATSVVVLLLLVDMIWKPGA